MAPYEDSPQPIGHGATISAPHMHAYACEHLLPYLVPATPGSKTAVRPERRVLDIGSGSGYLTHVLAELAIGSNHEAGNCIVVGVEHIKELKELGEANMAKSAEGRLLLDSGRVKFRVGDGRKGWREPDDEGKSWDEVGWDVIHVGAAAKELHPALVEQLRAPGRMFIPIEEEGWGDQNIWIVDKDEKGNVTKEKLFGVRYVPLTDAPKN